MTNATDTYLAITTTDGNLHFYTTAHTNPFDALHDFELDTGENPRGYSVITAENSIDAVSRFLSGSY